MFNRLTLLLVILLAAPMMVWGQIVIPGGGGIYPPAAGITPVMQAMVVDLYGRPVGTTSAFLMGPAFVLMQVNGRLMSVQVTRSGIGSSGGALFFMTPDCTGTPYIQPDPADALILPSVFGLPGRTLYLPRAGVVPLVMTPAAQMFVSSLGPSCSVMPPPPAGGSPIQISLVPADRSVDLNLFFTPPFSIRTQ